MKFNISNMDSFDKARYASDNRASFLDYTWRCGVLNYLQQIECLCHEKCAVVINECLNYKNTEIKYREIRYFPYQEF